MPTTSLFSLDPPRENRELPGTLAITSFVSRPRASRRARWAEDTPVTRLEDGRRLCFGPAGHHLRAPVSIVIRGQPSEAAPHPSSGRTEARRS